MLWRAKFCLTTESGRMSAATGKAEVMPQSTNRTLDNADIRPIAKREAERPGSACPSVGISANRSQPDKRPYVQAGALQTDAPRRELASHRDYAHVPLYDPQIIAAASEAANSGTAEGAIIGAIIGGVIGAGIGFATAGPAGAVAGGVIGAIGGGLVGGLIGSRLGAAPAGQPGNARTADLQPVVFRNNAADPTPTGGSWSRRFGPSNTIWGKLGVTFTSATPVTIDNATLKRAGGTRAERDSIRATHSDASKVCVFLTDNDLADAGGGGTVGGGAAGAKVALSDRGASNTLLAHELGHALGLGHPPGGADANTIMDPTGSNASDNPTRNTIGNYNRITWPAAGPPTTIHPDP